MKLKKLRTQEKINGICFYFNLWVTSWLKSKCVNICLNKNGKVEAWQKLVVLKTKNELQQKRTFFFLQKLVLFKPSKHLARHDSKICNKKCQFYFGITPTTCTIVLWINLRQQAQRKYKQSQTERAVNISQWALSPVTVKKENHTFWQNALTSFLKKRKELHL